MSQTATPYWSVPAGSIGTATAHEESGGMGDYVVSGLICILLCLAAMPFNGAVFHWFLAPIIGCGMIVGSDAVRCLRGRLDTFDTKALIGFVGLHFFFLAPLLYITIGSEMLYKRNPDDWRPWFGAMGGLNLLGLILYKVVQRIAQRGERPRKTIWTARPGRTGPIIAIGLVLATACFVYLLVRMGGIRGLAVAKTEDVAAMHKMGIPRIISYGLPMVAFFALTLMRRGSFSRSARLSAVLITLMTLGFAQLIVAGYGSSRGEVMTAGCWMLISVHYLWKRIGIMTLVWITVPAIAFMWAYAFYKALGVKVFDYLSRGTSIGELEGKTDRSFSLVLLGDLSRTDIQASIVWLLTTDPGNYQKRYGRTYLTAPTPMIPYWLWSGKPAHAEKVVAGTELFWGRSFYDPSRRRYTSHAYGLAGEAMLNFGVWSVPFAYGIWGFIVGRWRRYVRGVPPGDLRWLAIPFGTYFILNMLMWDSDNYIAHSMIRAGYPLLLLFVAVGRRPCTTDVTGVSW